MEYLARVGRHERAFELNGLRVLDLDHLIKGSVYIVQSEQIKLLPILTRLVQVVHEHLAHLEHWDGGVHGTLEFQFPHKIGQCSEVGDVGERQEDSIYLRNMSVCVRMERCPR